MTDRPSSGRRRRADRPSEFGLRLRRILDELSYAQDRKISVKDVARAIAMRTTRPFSESKLRELLYRQAWTAEDLRQVADGLQIDPKELLYDPQEARKQTRSVTTRRKRPKVGNVWDEIDRIPTPER